MKLPYSAAWTAPALTSADLTKIDTYVYTKIITAGSTLTDLDVSLIHSIFNEADHIYNAGYVNGEVYVGTSSVQLQEDISDDISYAQFMATYVKEIKNDTIGSNTLGNRLKVIDNNDDTVADYVLQTIYTVTKVATANDGKYTLRTRNEALTGIDEVNRINDPTVNVNTSGELKVDDVVLYARIDGKVQAWLAETETAKIDKVDRVNGKVTTTDSKEYDDSSVNVWPQPKSANNIGLGDNVTDLIGSTNYSLYFDLYGNLAAFNEANEKFVLLVDGWYNSTKGGDEYAVKAWIDGTIQTKDVNSSGELFIMNGGTGLNNDWTQIKALGTNNVDGSIGNLNAGRGAADNIKTTVAMLSDNGTLTPVDLAYNTLKQTAILAMDGDALPTETRHTGTRYITSGRTANGEREAYNTVEKNADGTAVTYDVRALSSTTYYFVYNVYNRSYDANGNATDKCGKQVADCAAKASAQLASFSSAGVSAVNIVDGYWEVTQNLPGSKTAKSYVQPGDKVYLDENFAGSAFTVKAGTQYFDKNGAKGSNTTAADEDYQKGTSFQVPSAEDLTAANNDLTVTGHWKVTARVGTEANAQAIATAISTPTLTAGTNWVAVGDTITVASSKKVLIDGAYVVGDGTTVIKVEGDMDIETLADAHSSHKTVSLTANKDGATVTLYTDGNGSFVVTDEYAKYFEDGAYVTVVEGTGSKFLQFKNGEWSTTGQAVIASAGAYAYISVSDLKNNPIPADLVGASLTIKSNYYKVTVDTIGLSDKDRIAGVTLAADEGTTTETPISEVNDGFYVQKLGKITLKTPADNAVATGDKGAGHYFWCSIEGKNVRGDTTAKSLVSGVISEASGAAITIKDVTGTEWSTLAG